ncbi:Virus attachment protein p12 family protein [Thiorhodovibrio winogradskyi]|uniref:Virus attachment protein p12 family protein n=1 Tax=Thiorhodovibrio winogradskyi TaxID=77007 RepID=A0ABZ0S8V2_9GAMM|nr:hypothetical protein [Thiorhodovibrio winogradskyi]
MNTTTEVAQTVAPKITAGRGASSGWFDLAITGVVIALALFYLYRKLWRQGGRCDGCGQAGGCAIKPPAAGAKGKLGKRR